MTTESFNPQTATREQMEAHIAHLEAEAAAVRAIKAGKLEFRIGEKGGVSVYGLGRFPVTLYYQQWVKLLSTAPELIEFLEEAVTSGKILADRPPKSQNTTGKAPVSLAQTARVAERVALRLVPMYRGKSDAELDAILDNTAAK